MEDNNYSQRKWNLPEEPEEPEEKPKGSIIKKILYILFIILVVVCALGALFFFKIYIPKKKAMYMQLAMMAANEPEVSVMQVKKERVESFIELPARINAKESAEVRPQVSGIIKDIAFTEGSFVKAGTQLYQIDSKPYALAYERAKAQADVLRIKKRRIEVLSKHGGASKQDFDDIKALLIQAEVAEKDAKLNLEYSKVLAPISGFISTTNVTKGSLVLSGQPNALANITDIKTIYADMVIPSKNWLESKIKKSTRVALENNGKEISGILTASGVVVDQSSDTIKLRAEIDNEGNKFLPGMFVNAKLYTQSFSSIVVPQRITFRSPSGDLFVWFVSKDNTVTAKQIKINGMQGENLIVTEGISEGDTIVSEGMIKLREGMKVKLASASNVATTPNK